MKTLAELKEMSFIPHHDCSLCGSLVGWVVSKDALKPYFDPSCDCGSSGGHFDTWEDVFKWYNTVEEKETEEAVQAAWNKEAMELEMKNNPCIYCNGKVGDGKILCGDPEDIGEITNIVKTDDGFEIEHWGGFANIASVKINFCPMCGRKLAEAKK